MTQVCSFPFNSSLFCFLLVSANAHSQPSEPRSIIETLKSSDQHKKLLDSVLLDKLILDEEVKLEEEAATEEVIRSYKAIKEKNDPGVFVLLIRIEVKFDFLALADTSSNIYVLPYRIYAKLGRDQVKPVTNKITMLDHSKAEPMGILRDVLCQVGVTTIIAKKLILDIPIDRDVPIVVGRSFLYTYGSILNTIKGTTSTFDGVCHQKFYVAQKGDGDGKWHANVRIVDPYGNLFDQGYQTRATKRKMSKHYKPQGVVNNMGCVKEIEAMLEIKVYEMGEEEEIFNGVKRKGAGSQRDSMICYGQFNTRIARRMGLLTDKALDGLSASTYCRALDATTLREADLH
ncbi:reverse transcriptase domain-containing protein [Tanacetum coccineum]